VPPLLLPSAVTPPSEVVRERDAKTDATAAYEPPVSARQGYGKRWVSDDDHLSFIATAPNVQAVTQSPQPMQSEGFTVASSSGPILISALVRQTLRAGQSRHARQESKSTWATRTVVPPSAHGHSGRAKNTWGGSSIQGGQALSRPGTTGFHRPSDRQETAPHDGKTRMRLRQREIAMAIGRFLWFDTSRSRHARRLDDRRPPPSLAPTTTSCSLQAHVRWYTLSQASAAGKDPTA